MSFTDLIVFNKAYKVVMDIYHLTKHFPQDEKYSLTDQIRRSSRSVCANIAEGYRKKIYPKSFIAKLADADGECSETIVHLMFSRDCGYISDETFEQLHSAYSEVGRILGAIINKPENFVG